MASVAGENQQISENKQAYGVAASIVMHQSGVANDGMAASAYDMASRHQRNIAASNIGGEGIMQHQR